MYRRAVARTLASTLALTLVVLAFAKCKVFYVMGKVLTGELSYLGIVLVRENVRFSLQIKQKGFRFRGHMTAINTVTIGQVSLMFRKSDQNLHHLPG